MSTLGSRIKLRRKYLKLTQKELAKRIGVSDVAVGYWEKDENDPSSKHLMALAEVLGITMEDLVGPKHTIKSPQSEYKVEPLSEDSMAIAQAAEACPPAVRKTFLHILQALRDSDKS